MMPRETRARRGGFRRPRALVGMLLVLGGNAVVGSAWAESRIVPLAHVESYDDGRPAARYRLPVRDHGVVLRHGGKDAPYDELGARDVWVWEHEGSYYLHYDGAGPRGWLACLATSDDLVHWRKHGPVLDLGAPGTEDSASASYGVTFFNGADWDLFYMGTPHASPAPDRVPAFPYLTLKARAASPLGPWVKQPGVVPFRPQPGTYTSVTASPGHIVRRGAEYVMFFSASTAAPIQRTLSIARTRDLNGSWAVNPEPILPLDEQIENAAIHHDEASGVWYLFTNHVGLKGSLEYTDAIWVYWTRDPEHWNAADKAVVLDGATCSWSRSIIGLPSVVVRGNRLALFYDGHAGDRIPPGVKSHMSRDIGLAWIDLPIILPDVPRESRATPVRSLR